MKERLKLAGFFILIISLLMVFIAGISAGVHYLSKPSPEKFRSELLQIIKNGGLTEILSDDQYDDTYLLAELKGQKIENLMSFVRPIEISITDINGNILDQLYGTGLLMGKYVITSPQLFSFLAIPEVQLALQAGEIQVVIKICADSLREDEWKFELIENVAIGDSVVILERSNSLIFPVPAEFPFRLGRIEDLNLQGREDSLLGIGTFLLEMERKTLHTYQGKVELTRPDEGIILFSSALFPSDFGGPIFALRDGEPELIAIVQLGGDGKARAISVQTILSEMEKILGPLEIKFKE